MTAQMHDEGEIRVETCQYTWCFDDLRHRFRRFPRGRDPGDPAVEADWEPYSSVECGPDGAMTVLLDPSGTLRMRVVE
jgi:hypothetical protein